MPSGHLATPAGTETGAEVSPLSYVEKKRPSPKGGVSPHNSILFCYHTPHTCSSFPYPLGLPLRMRGLHGGVCRVQTH